MSENGGVLEQDSSFNVDTGLDVVSNNDVGFDHNDVITRNNDDDRRLANARSTLESWLADSEITDFDEFFRQTLRAGASKQRTSSAPTTATSILQTTLTTVLTLILHKLLQLT